MTFAVTGGALPSGVVLDASTGIISGTATASGAFSATITATDANGRQATMSVSFTVAAAVVAPSTGTLPATGTDARAMTELGLMLLAFGAVITRLARPGGLARRVRTEG